MPNGTSNFADALVSSKTGICDGVQLFDLIIDQHFFSHVGTDIPQVEPVLKQRIKCFAQGHNSVHAVRLESATPRSRVKHSAIEQTTLLMCL